MEEIVKEFLAESAEGLDRLERELVELEHDPTSSQRLAEIFRAVHTIKGSSGMLGYSKLESVAHAGEEVLGALRNGNLALNPALTSGLLAMVDALRALLRAIERTGSEGPGDYGNVARSLEELLRNPAMGGGVATAAHNAAADLPEGENSVGGTIRVDVVLLDRMMDLLGELVLARNQILRLASSQTGSAILNAAQRLKRVTGDMQDAVIKTRLQPIGSVWNKFPRQARDLALGCGKQVIVEMAGSETELDRALLEAIRDPLTHILRNAIAHGIETPQQRIRAGKPAAGHLRFRACHLEGRIHVEAADDGAGLNLERVRRRAVELGLLTPEQAVEAEEERLARLVFAAGFSTADTVTKVSGRGVGLDVVKTNIQRIGGTVDLHSVRGEGTTLHITLPLTLAILPALIVSSGGQRFAIPQANLVEVARLENGPKARSIEVVCGAPVFRLHDELLPLCFLDGDLRLESSQANDLHIVVLQSGAGQFGVVVDSLHDTEEIVVKPLGPQLRAIACFAGASILGDGRVVLVVDVDGLAQMTGVVAGRRGLPARDTEHIKETCDEAARSWLVFRGTTGSRYALPVSAVTRLEEIPAERIERSAGREVVQYGGQIMPLLRVSRLFHEPEQERGLLQVAVLRESSLPTGLVMDRIEDIVEAVVDVEPGRHNDLLQGSAVIHGRVADVLNLKNILARGEIGRVPEATEGGR
jgi:two-component system chemotaxis sensor kinase CheA